MLRNFALLAFVMIVPACATPAEDSAARVAQLAHDLADGGDAALGRGATIRAPIVESTPSTVKLRADDLEDVVLVRADGPDLVAKSCDIRPGEDGRVYLDLDNVVSSDGMHIGSLRNIPYQ